MTSFVWIYSQSVQQNFTLHIPHTDLVDTNCTFAMQYV